MKDLYFLNFRRVSKEEFEAFQQTADAKRNAYLARQAERKAKYGDRYDLDAMRVRRRKEIFGSWAGFTKWLREVEHLVWVKITQPRGHYSVRENSDGTFNVLRSMTLEEMDPVDRRYHEQAIRRSIEKHQASMKK